jgi:hypothetical protein
MGAVKVKNSPSKKAGFKSLGVRRDGTQVLQSEGCTLYIPIFGRKPSVEQENLAPVIDLFTRKQVA